MKRIIALFTLIIAIFGCGIFIYKMEETSPKDNVKKENINMVKKKKEDDEKRIKIMAMGDIMCHNPQLKGAFDSKSKTYDFSNQFKHLGKYFNEADLVIGNFETTSAPDNYPISSYPNFNSPIDLIKSLKEAGFDILSTCNNHSLDTKKKGVISTIDKLDKIGIEHFGTRKSKTDSRIYIKDVEGIKIGLLAYSYGFNGMEGVLSKEDLDIMLNLINEEKIKEDIENTKKEGAEIIIVYPHWGNEYQTKENDKQIELAHKMIDWGADAVLGSHPHVLQEAEIVKKGDKDKFIIYSMGNAVSSQTPAVLHGHPVDIGALVEFEIVKKKKTLKLENIKIIPTYVNRVNSPRRYYEVLPTDEFLDDNSQLTKEYSPEFRKKALSKRDKAFEILNFSK